MPSSSLMFLMFTTRLGVCRCSFIRLSRSVPPARTSASPHLAREQRHRFLNGRRIGVFKGLHYAFLPSSALSTCIGVIGIFGTRTPIALATALPTAAQMPMAGGSPSPMTPRLSLSVADIHVDDDIADIADAGQLVELHVGVQHAAGGVVHDALFEQRGGDAHDDGAVDLAFGQPRVDDQAAILHGHEAVHAAPGRSRYPP